MRRVNFLKWCPLLTYLTWQVSLASQAEGTLDEMQALFSILGIPAQANKNQEKSSNIARNQEEDLCNTETCVHIASRMLSMIDRRVSPCQDFYRFACGRWQTSNLDKIDRENFFYDVSTNEMGSKLESFIQLLVTGKIKIDRRFYTSISYRNMKSFFDACVNVENIKREGYKPVLDLLTSLENFQVTKPFEDSSWDLTQGLLDLFRVNGSPLFEVSIDTMPQNSTQWGIVITKPQHTGLTQELQGSAHKWDEAIQLSQFLKQFLNNKKKQPTQDMKLKGRQKDDFADMEFSKIFGTDFAEEFSTLSGRQAVPLEGLLYDSPINEADNVTSTPTVDSTFNMLPILDRRALFYDLQEEINKQKIADLVEIIETLSGDDFWRPFWLPVKNRNEAIKKIIEFIMLLDKSEPTRHDTLVLTQQGQIYKNNYTVQQLQEEFPIVDWCYLITELTNTTIYNNETVLVYYPDYLQKMSRIVMDSEPWLVHHGILILYVHDILKELVTIDEVKLRDKYCVKVTKQAFPDVVSHMYLNKIGRGKIRHLRKELEPLIKELTKAMVEDLENSTWMNDADAESAKRKIFNFKWEIGGLEKYADLQFIEATQAEIDFVIGDSYFENVINFYRRARKGMFSLFSEEVDYEFLIWGAIAKPFTLNAFHDRQSLSIVVPEAILRPPYYNPGAPRYIEYGSTGTILAHEMYHALDFPGIGFDENGNLRKNRPVELIKKMREKLKCFEALLDKHFNEIAYIEGIMLILNIDKNVTLNENLADLAGLETSFRAYKNAQRKGPQEPLLPAVPYSRDQLFFISYVQPHCGIFPDLSKVILLELDEHLPGSMRMNSLLMNSNEFRDAFKCKSGDKMAAIQNSCEVF